MNIWRKQKQQQNSKKSTLKTNTRHRTRNYNNNATKKKLSIFISFSVLSNLVATCYFFFSFTCWCSFFCSTSAACTFLIFNFSLNNCCTNVHSFSVHLLRLSDEDKNKQLKTEVVEHYIFLSSLGIHSAKRSAHIAYSQK